MKLTPARRDDALMVALALAVIGADQLTKYWIVQYFVASGPKPPIPILGQVVRLEYTQNTGVAFSLLQGQGVLYLFIGVALAVIGWLYWRMRETGGLAIKLTFGLILGGALGNNLIDRLRQGYVVDFIHFQIPGRFDFPVFNLADSAISIGVVVLAYLLWRSAPEHSASTRAPIRAPGEVPPAPPDAAMPRVRNPRARARSPSRSLALALSSRARFRAICHLDGARGTALRVRDCPPLCPPLTARRLVAYTEGSSERSGA